MKIDMIVAMSQDGFITNGNDPSQYAWTSDEDKKFFHSTKSKYNFFVMGSRTYDNNSGKFDPNVLRVVLTRKPDNYTEFAVPDQLVFLNISIEDLVEKYKEKYNKCLVLGGGSLYEAFLEKGLVDTLYLTVEPVTFGEGTRLLPSGKNLAEFNLPEPEIKVANESGTEIRAYHLK